ncbi:esterase-5B-like [Musca autumnalis]|uniref:esterase-5B-like n=1 Tax=Musca autumnalis TaxID=221902 RepID=UPI003CF55CE6
MCKTIIFCLALLVTLFKSGLCYENETNSKLYVRIPNGVLKGKDNNGSYYSWEAIPYAEAPVGKKRFEPPKPYNKQWSEVFNATQKAPPCMQWDQLTTGDNKVHGSEDCLMLNVYKPITEVEEAFPVMAFIHGGCFMFGSAYLHQPQVLMASGKMILVTIAYRLGALGFLSCEDEGLPGNLGLKDQRLALRWIKKNIRRFGGDPNKILLTGFSAGGVSVHLHTLQDPKENVARAVMALSGAALNAWAIIENAKKRCFKAAEFLNCPKRSNGAEIKECLKQKNAEEIVATAGKFQTFYYNPFNIFGPSIEPSGVPGAFLTEHPIAIIKSGNFTHVPILFSYSAEEGGYNAAELMQINPLTGREVMYELNDNWKQLLVQNLFLDNIISSGKLSNLYSYVLWIHGILKAMALHKEYSRAPVYGYKYDNPADYNLCQYFANRTDICCGSVHADDFTTVCPIEIRSPLRPDEKIISHNLIAMFYEFVENCTLSYDYCKFVDNTAQKGSDLSLTLIERYTCSGISVEFEKLLKL